MTWQTRYSRTFLKELARLPAEVRGRVQKLTGYPDYYKIRFGDYRVGLQLDAATEQITFLRVLHRREIYRRFP